MTSSTFPQTHFTKVSLIAVKSKPYSKWMQNSSGGQLNVKDIEGWWTAPFPPSAALLLAIQPGPVCSSFPRPLLSNGIESFGLGKTLKTIKVQPGSRSWMKTLNRMGPGSTHGVRAPAGSKTISTKLPTHPSQENFVGDRGKFYQSPGKQHP